MDETKENSQIKRNAMGDWDTPKTPFDWEKFRWWQNTYVFQRFDEELKMYRPFWDVTRFHDENLEKARQEKDFLEIEIMQITDGFFRNSSFDAHGWMHEAFLHFFKEVFEIKAFVQGHHWHFDFSRLILPKSLFHEIMNVINDHDLLHVRDLILFIIAKTQDFYSEHVRFWEQPAQKKMVRNIDKEVQKIIKMIEKVEDKTWMNDPDAKRPAELLHINFAFQDETIKVADPWIAKEFINEFKKRYEEGSYKNWKLQLEALPSNYEQYRQKQQFKFRLAKAIYKFFTETQLFKLGSKTPYPSKLMKCIGKIIEFGLIPVKDFHESDSVKIRHIRNWIRLHEIKPALTYEKIELDRNKLYKYFDREFIDSVDDVKRADAISNGFFLCKRFDSMPLIREVIHLMACLRDWHWRISSQLENKPRGDNQNLPAEYESFKLLIQSMKKGKPLAKFSFQLDGGEKEYQLTDRLPLHFIQRAIQQHYTDFKEDYETDILQSEIKNVDQSGSFSCRTTGKFNLPEERFFPRIVNSFYNYLLNESPPTEREHTPSERYYLFIAKALHLSYYFQTSYPEEWELAEKVKYWHSLTQKGKD